MTHRILFIASEVQPWIKTGGLADVAGALPKALAALGHDVRVLLPAYGDILADEPGLRPVHRFQAPAGFEDWQLVTPTRRTDGIRLWLAAGPGFSDRRGSPYLDEHGQDWPDNAIRFNAFCRIATALAAGRAGAAWRPHVVHCNDWQTGLVPVWMQQRRVPAASVFTVHNLNYHGRFEPQTLHRLGLPSYLWHADALEFHGDLSFIKGGLVFADMLTTVSPTYAEEICTPACGEGLDGLMRHRRSDLVGILNGIDPDEWDPRRDPHLPANFSAEDLTGKRQTKQHLQQALGLEVTAQIPLLTMISRLVPQKGVDLVLQALPELLNRGAVQLAVLGSGESALEQRLRDLASAYPGQVAVQIGFDEALAHRLEAAGDLFLMPSRFEPCGLNQLYSLRYGTAPIVHHCGGLADSVVDVTAAPDAGTGFVFDQQTPEALGAAIERALALFRQPQAWQRLQHRGMTADFGWKRSARAYVEVYDEAMTRLARP